MLGAARAGSEGATARGSWRRALSLHGYHGCRATSMGVMADALRGVNVTLQKRTQRSATGCVVFHGSWRAASCDPQGAVNDELHVAQSLMHRRSNALAVGLAACGWGAALARTYLCSHLCVFRCERLRLPSALAAGRWIGVWRIKRAPGTMG